MDRISSGINAYNSPSSPADRGNTFTREYLQKWADERAAFNMVGLEEWVNVNTGYEDMNDYHIAALKVKECHERQRSILNLSNLAGLESLPPISLHIAKVILPDGSKIKLPSSPPHTQDFTQTEPSYYGSTQLDKFKAAGRNYNEAFRVQTEFITLCEEIANHIAEIGREYPDNEADVSRPVFEAVEELVKEKKYTAAQVFLHLLKSKLDTDHAEKMSQLKIAIPVKNQIVDRSGKSFDTDADRLNHIKSLFPGNQITCLSSAYAEKMRPIETLLTQIEGLVSVNQNPLSAHQQNFGSQTRQYSLLRRRLDFSSVSSTSSEKGGATSNAASPTTRERVDFFQAQALLNNHSELTNDTFSIAIDSLKNANPPHQEMAKARLNGLLREAMEWREKGELAQIDPTDWVAICCAMVRETDDIEIKRKLSIAILFGNNQLGINKDQILGRVRLMKLALLTPKGDLPSQLLLAEHYLSPSTNSLSASDLSPFASKARELFELAFTQHGSEEARLQLEEMNQGYAQRSMPKFRQNVEKTSYQKSVPGYTNEIFITGMKHLEGNEEFGIPKDPYYAASYFHEIAGSGHVAANFELGKICVEIYRNGINPGLEKLPNVFPKNANDFYWMALKFFNVALAKDHPGTPEAISDLQELCLQRMSAPPTEAVTQQ